jgi:hypothetical protein
VFTASAADDARLLEIFSQHYVIADPGVVVADAHTFCGELARGDTLHQAYGTLSADGLDRSAVLQLSASAMRAYSTCY